MDLVITDEIRQILAEIADGRRQTVWIALSLGRRTLTHRDAGQVDDDDVDCSTSFRP